MIKLLKGLKIYWFLLIVLFIFVFLQTQLDLILPNIAADIINKGVVLGDTEYILNKGQLMILVAIGSLIASVIVTFIGSRVATKLSANIRTKVFSKVTEFSNAEVDQFGTASLITRATNDITQIQNFVSMLLRVVIASPFTAFGAIYYANQKNSDLTWIIWAVIPIVATLMGVSGYLMMKLFTVRQIKLDGINRVLRENLIGIRVIRAFNKVNFEKKRFDLANKEITDVSIKANKVMATVMPIMTFVFSAAQISVIWFGGLKISNGLMQIGDLTAFISYIMQFMFALIMFSIMFILLPQASASAKRINAVLNTELSVKETNSNVNTDDSSVLEFKNVSFKFPEASEPALENISFKAIPGQTTAIIGGTGSGKSTLINLMLRFFDLTEGEILLNNKNIKEYSFSSLRDHYGYVPQKAALFSGTIRENIAYGNPNATLEEIKKAAQIAQASSFIEDLEEGYDSHVAQGGSNFSGGQKQRLSIARAICKNASIYLLDDSLSALDFKTDANLRKALQPELVNKTTIIVAQRVASIMNAEQIIVLNSGVIVGSGTHSELLETCEVYQEICESQLSKEEM